MRIFVAINFDDTIKEKIFALKTELKDSFPLKGIKWEEKSKYHITLQFLGDVFQENIPGIISSLESIKTGYEKFYLEAGNIDAFPNLQRARIFFLHFNETNRKINSLASNVRDRLMDAGFYPDKKFSSHVTLGRVKVVGEISFAEKLHGIKGDFKCEVNSFELMKSTLKHTGSEYEVIKSFPFLL